MQWKINLCSEEEIESSEEEGATAAEWTSKNVMISWSSLSYTPYPSGVILGPTAYTLASIRDVKSCFDLLYTTEILQLGTGNTNLHERRGSREWKDVDA